MSAPVRPQWGPDPDPAGACATAYQLRFWRAGYANVVHYHRQIRDVCDRARGLSAGGQPLQHPVAVEDREERAILMIDAVVRFGQVGYLVYVADDLTTSW